MLCCAVPCHSRLCQQWALCTNSHCCCGLSYGLCRGRGCGPYGGELWALQGTHTPNQFFPSPPAGTHVTVGCACSQAKGQVATAISTTGGGGCQHVVALWSSPPYAPTHKPHTPCHSPHP